MKNEFVRNEQTISDNITEERLAESKLKENEAEIEAQMMTFVEAFQATLDKNGLKSRFSIVIEVGDEKTGLSNSIISTDTNPLGFGVLDIAMDVFKDIQTSVRKNDDVDYMIKHIPKTKQMLQLVSDMRITADFISELTKVSKLAHKE